MSRSIHETRRSAFDTQHRKYKNRTAREFEPERLSDQLSKKRRIKKQVKLERRGEVADARDWDSMQIPIIRMDQGPFVHFPASPQDIKAVLVQLPVGVLDGLTEIRLCLGLEDQEEEEPGGKHRDPYTGRIGMKRLPGVFGGMSLGVYLPWAKRMQIYAYVYDPGLEDREMWELYLRLRMLSTLIHEVGHHYDLSVPHRIARGQRKQTDSVEGYALKRQHEWTLKYVVPYLRNAYPEETRRLEKWIEVHGAVAMPLERLVASPIETMGLDVQSSFEFLVSDVANGEDRIETLLDFAKSLHFGTLVHASWSCEDSIHIVDRVLDEHPQHAKAIILKAHLLGHEKDLDGAGKILEELLARDGNNFEAWDELSGILELKESWAELEYAATQALELTAPGSGDRVCLLRRRFEARAELGNYYGAQGDLRELESNHGPYGKRRAAEYREWSLGE